MKKKTFGIFVCVLMIATILPVASSTGENNINQTAGKTTVDDGCRCGNENDKKYSEK
jgi:hypothetical protein